MIIGVNGKKQTGKDTVARIIQQIHPEFRIVRFADKLKKIVSILTDIPVEDMEKESVKSKILPKEFWVYKLYLEQSIYTLIPYVGNEEKYPESTLIKPTLRYYLQYIGTDLFRDKLHPDIWINSVLRNYTDEDNLVIPDLRFYNEYKKIKELGGITIRIKRETGIKDSHKSENELNNTSFDFEIDNNSGIKELNNKVINIINKFY